MNFMSSVAFPSIYCLLVKIKKKVLLSFMVVGFSGGTVEVAAYATNNSVHYFVIAGVGNSFDSYCFSLNESPKE